MFQTTYVLDFPFVLSIFDNSGIFTASFLLLLNISCRVHKPALAITFKMFTSLGFYMLPSLLALASAQTYTSCNPLHNSSCPTDPALGRTLDLTSFSKIPQGFREQSSSINCKNDEIEFVIDKSGNAPTIISNFYIFFGTVSVIMKASPGTGIVSSVVLESDDLYEIDWEWLGGNTAQVETNYFGKGNTTSYDGATYVPADMAQSRYHNYTLDWTSDKIDWIIDDKVVRTLKYAEANGGRNYPQTPATIRIGSVSPSNLLLTPWNTPVH